MTIPPDKRGFTYDAIEEPHAFVQWKGTDVCMDFYCECGAHCHFDGAFAYTVKCPHCQTVWEMPFHVFPRKVCDQTDEYWKDNPKLLEPDEDHCGEQIDDDGVTQLIPHPVSP